MDEISIVAKVPLLGVVEALNQMSSSQLQLIKRHLLQLQHQQSLLIALPPELRTHIYAIVVESHLRQLPKGFYHRYEPKQLMPALFKTCQQLRSEGVHLFFSDYMSVEIYDYASCNWRKSSVDEACKLYLRYWYTTHDFLLGRFGTIQNCSNI